MRSAAELNSLSGGGWAAGPGGRRGRIEWRQGSLAGWGRAVVVGERERGEAGSAADFDADGDVDAADNTAYSNANTAGDASADLNLDGVVDFNDTLAWNNLYNAGETGGRSVLSRTSARNRIGYAGYQHDPSITGSGQASGQSRYHVRFRVYDAGVGRWTRRDPLGYPDGPALYRFVRSNPVWLIDPLGLQSKPCHPGPRCQPGSTVWATDRCRDDEQRGRNVGFCCLSQGVQSLTECLACCIDSIKKNDPAGWGCRAVCEEAFPYIRPVPPFAPGGPAPQLPEGPDSNWPCVLDCAACGAYIGKKFISGIGNVLLVLEMIELMDTLVGVTAECSSCLQGWFTYPFMSPRERAGWVIDCASCGIGIPEFIDVVDRSGRPPLDPTDVKRVLGDVLGGWADCFGCMICTLGRS